MLAAWAMLGLCGVGLVHCGPDVGSRDSRANAGPREQGATDSVIRNQGAPAVPARPIEAVLADHTQELMALPGVVGVYQGQLDDGTPCIGVLIREAKPDITAKIPSRVEGYPTKIEESGEIRPMGK